LLAEYFLSRFAKGMKINNLGLSDEVKNTLTNYQWPGNVRELSNTIQKALIFNRGGPIRQEEISQALHGEGMKKDVADQSAMETIRQWVRQNLVSGMNENMFDYCMEHFASVLISEALSITSGNRVRAAKVLGLSRPTLQSKIEKYKIKIETSIKNN
jgi:DNA-binding NtrC family response regulator